MHIVRDIKAQHNLGKRVKSVIYSNVFNHTWSVRKVIVILRGVQAK